MTPNFFSHKFCSLSKICYIPHKTISPHYHPSNRLAERSIQTVKQNLNKAKPNSEDQFLAILSLNLPLDENGTSLVEKLFGRKLRTTLLSLTPSTQSASIEKHTVAQNVNCPILFQEQQCKFETTKKTSGKKR